MYQPAPPSWLASTDPPLLWDDTSPKLRYLLSGKHTLHLSINELKFSPLLHKVDFAIFTFYWEKNV